MDHFKLKTALEKIQEALFIVESFDEYMDEHEVDLEDMHPEIPAILIYIEREIERLDLVLMDIEAKETALHHFLEMIETTYNNEKEKE